MKTYVDGFVLTIPIEKRNEYKKMAREAKKVWLGFGALDYKECRADDVTPPHVSLTFPKMIKAKEGEEVWFSFIVFASKKERTEINKKVMAHFEKKYEGKKEQDMPFDMKRMAYGGFITEVE